MIWNLFPFEGDFSLGEKPEVTGCQTWAVEGLSHLGVLMLHKKLCRRCDAWAGMLWWWSCQSPVAHSCGLLNHSTSFCGGILKLTTKCDADSLCYSLSYFEYDSHTVHMLTQRLPPRWLVQWSHHCSHMRIPVYFPWLWGYIRVMKTVLITLTMAGIFPDRPHRSEECSGEKWVWIWTHALSLFVPVLQVF